MMAVAAPGPIGQGWEDQVRRMAAKDNGGLQCLYDVSHRIAYSLAYRILGNDADAEEAVLDAYMQAWRLAPEYQTQRGSAYTWLMTFVRCRAIDRLRARQVRPEDPLDAAPGLAAGADSDPEADAAMAEFRRRILAMLETLPDSTRQALELAYFEGLSHSEIAFRLGEPLGTVKTRIRRGLQVLRASV